MVCIARRHRALACSPQAANSNQDCARGRPGAWRPPRPWKCTRPGRPRFPSTPRQRSSCRTGLSMACRATMVDCAHNRWLERRSRGVYSEDRRVTTGRLHSCFERFTNHVIVPGNHTASLNQVLGPGVYWRDRHFTDKTGVWDRARLLGPCYSS